MKIEEFKELLHKKCCEVTTKVAETKGKRLLKKEERDEILNLIFSEIKWYINNDVINGQELVETFTPEELFAVGFLTQENNPIDFSQIVNIDGVNWYNENEPCGIVEEDNIIVYKDVKLTKKEYCKRCDAKDECKGRKSNCIYGINDIDDDDDFFYGRVA